MIKKIINNIKIKLIKMLGGYVYSPPKIIRVTPEIVTLRASYTEDCFDSVSEDRIKTIFSEIIAEELKPIIPIEKTIEFGRTVYRVNLRIVKE